MNINIIPEMQAVMISINTILIGKDRRYLVESAVQDLARSIERIGLQTPITVRDIGCGEFYLIAGRHRMAAFQQLGRTEIPAIVRDCSEVDAELWEIAENLHRADLTDLQRDEQIARWIELTEAKQNHLRQSDANESRREDGRGHRREGGVRAAARELGLSEADARRAVKVASLSPEAKQAARETGLDDNRSALLEAAKEKTPEAQVAALHVRGTFGSGENEWYTPQQYLDAARDVLGSIDLDPASNAIAQENVQAATFYTKEDDGLTKKWSGRVWLNPPYAQPAIANFVTKIVDEKRSGRVTAAIMLTHNYTDTSWFHHAASEADAICFTRGRIKFEAPDGKIAAPTQGQAFFYFGSDAVMFCEMFKAFGFVVEVRR